MKCRALVTTNSKQNLVWFGSYGLDKSFGFKTQIETYFYNQKEIVIENFFPEVQTLYLTYTIIEPPQNITFIVRYNDNSTQTYQTTTNSVYNFEDFDFTDVKSLTILSEKEYENVRVVYNKVSYNGLFYKTKQKENIVVNPDEVERDRAIFRIYENPKKNQIITLTDFKKAQGEIFKFFPKDVILNNGDRYLVVHTINYQNQKSSTSFFWPSQATSFDLRNIQRVEIEPLFDMGKLFIYYNQVYSSQEETHESYSERQEGIKNSLIQRLSVIKGELWYKMSYGLPLLDKIRNKGIYDTVIINIINSHPDVRNIVYFNSKIVGREYHFDFIVNSIYNDEIEISYDLSYTF